MTGAWGAEGPDASHRPGLPARAADSPSAFRFQKTR